MRLPFQPPLAPMLAKLSDALPESEGWLYEPKWDGFRAVVFKSGDELLIHSRDLKPLGRYFPELEAALKAHAPERCVLDGEIVLATNGRLDFEALQLRLHPAASRVKLLAEQTPTAFVAWDLLALGDEDLRDVPQRERRERLVSALGAAKPPLHVTPATTDRAVAADWFTRFEGAGLDGVIAKPLEQPYRPDKRAMLKIKHQRTADCVVAGFRWFKNGTGTLVGSLVLALYDGEQLLPVGVCASFTRARRAELLHELAPHREGALEQHPWKQWLDAHPEHAGGFGSRWNPGKELSWEPLVLGLVAEVSYDHMEGKRFRHTAHFVRWRPDKTPADCRFDQLEVTPPHELQQIFSTRG
ncbi:MAG: ATP-dependent DNA ligase [Archangiaceae bacterium]|nr:ATP-dependent DNA ligase [Archangiaceae bacterium]